MIELDHLTSLFDQLENKAKADFDFVIRMRAELNSLINSVPLQPFNSQMTDRKQNNNQNLKATDIALSMLLETNKHLCGSKLGHKGKSMSIDYTKIPADKMKCIEEKGTRQAQRKTKNEQQKDSNSSLVISDKSTLNRSAKRPKQLKQNVPKPIVGKTISKPEASKSKTPIKRQASTPKSKVSREESARRDVDSFNCTNRGKSKTPNKRKSKSIELDQDTLENLMKNKKELNPNFVLIHDNTVVHALTLVVSRGFVSSRKSFDLGILSNSLRPAARQALAPIVQKQKERLNKKKKELSVTLNAFKENLMCDKSLLEYFEPSKTSRNGLNFVSNKDLLTYEGKEQPIVLTNLLKLIYFLAKETQVEEANLAKHLISTVFVERKVTSLKEFFLNILVKNTDFSDEEFRQLAAFYEENKKALGPGLMKISRSLSYISFILKEMMDYIIESNKSFKGVLIQEIRQSNREMTLIEEELKKLEKITL